MSDANTVAQVMGIPAELVTRSAEARAAAAGTTAEDVLAAWGGGATVATATPPPETTEPSVEEATDDDVAIPAEAPDVATPDAAAPVVQPMPDGPAMVTATSGEPPVLVGTRDHPKAVLAGAIGVFVMMVLLGLVGAVIPVDEPGERTSTVSLSDAGVSGQALYEDLGCAGCHTQMVRPVVADVGIGPVTLNDTNQVLGVRRFGPDLSNIGNRMSGAQMESTIRGSAGHPAANLSDQAMDDLTTYLLESAPQGGGS